MELLDVKIYPDDVLREKCEGVQQVDKEIKQLLDKMLHTMRYHNGIGLAGPQVGVTKRIIVVEVGSKVLKIVNPEIVSKKGKNKMIEGCLSLSDARVRVTRASEITLIGLNENGEKIKLDANGLLATVLQHEVEHLSGKLIIDYMNFFKRKKYKRKRSGK